MAEEVTATDAELTWTVPDVEGKWFYFKVEAHDDERVVGSSGYVSIAQC